MTLPRRRLARAAAGSLAALAALGGSARAQAPAGRRVARVAFLSSASTTERPAYHAFRKALRDAGWIEGQNLELSFHFGSGAGQARLEPMARAIAEAKVDAVLGDGRVATLAMANASRSIPIIGIMGVDPVGTGLAQSLARPGGNVSGMSLFSEQLNTKRLEVLREIAPRARRFGIVFGSSGLPSMELLLKTARDLSLEMTVIGVQSLDDLDTRLRSADLEQLDAFLVGTDGFLDAIPARVVLPINRLRRPAIFPDKPYAEAGGLASYGVDYGEMFTRLAGMVDRVLRGAAPATMPFEQPERFDLTLNLRTAREAGITFPPLVLAQAREIID